MVHAIVVTSIHGITDAVDSFAELEGWDVYYVADESTPEISDEFLTNHDNFHLISTTQQKEFPEFESTSETEFNKFQRKNIGYLHAINDGATLIADVDDDNIPYNTWYQWGEGKKVTRITDPKFPNVYQMYTCYCDKMVWPRGVPLDEIQDETPISHRNAIDKIPDIAVVQGLVDGDPDVDAIHRLTVDESEYDFIDNGVTVLNEGVWSPFNAQNTLWKDQSVYAYMYLPNTVSMRVTDILRSYVAQYGLWAMEKHVAFNDASVIQDRNPHDLMEDFEDELSNYMDIKGWVETLENTNLIGNPQHDIYMMYLGLVAELFYIITTYSVVCQN